MKFKSAQTSFVHSLHLVLCAFALLFAMACSSNASAQTSVTDGVLINADTMFRDLVKKTVRLKGNVQVVFQNQHLSCDQAVIDLQKQLVTAEGHVVLTNERVHVEGDRLIFNYKNNTGFIYNGFVQSGQVVFEGDVVEKIGEDHYLASNAFYTACETCPPGWSFTGRKIDAQLGGYARIQRPVFRIAGVPILMLPSLIVPLKSSRQSGMLVPSLDYSSKGGVALAMIYFWAIDRSQDVTLTAKWYRLRGFKVHEDYRYVLSPESQGRLQGAWINDRVLKEERLVNGNIDRWFVNYDHHYELPSDYVHRANLRLVSDLRYTRDFPEEIPDYRDGDPALENKMSLTKTTDNNYVSAEVDLYTNLLRTYPLAHDEDAVHRAPEIRYNLKDQNLGDTGFVVGLNVDYVNYARNTYGYDDLEACNDSLPQTGGAKVPCASQYALMPLGSPSPDPNDDLPKGGIRRDGVFNRQVFNSQLGKYQLGDLQRTGQRLDIQPTLAYPFQIAHKFDILPYVRYRETQYRFDPPIADDGEPAFSSTAARRYLETTVLARTEFSHVYGNLQDPKAARWKHSIEPQVGYSQIPILHKPNHPFFGNFDGQQYSRQFEPLSDKDLGNPGTGVQFDYNDRTYEKRVIDFSLDNRFTQKIWNALGPDYATILRFNIAQSYDFNESQRKIHAHPWSNVDGLIDLRLEHVETYTTLSYNPYANKTNTSIRVKGLVTTKTYLEVSYHQDFLLNEEDYSLIPGTESRTVGLGGGFDVKYLETLGGLEINDKTHKIQSWGYGLKIRPPGNCWSILINHSQGLTGDAKIYASLNFDFGGERKPGKM